MRRAIGWIRDHFDQPLRIEALAVIAGMSTASFHRHFKAATAMSPLQYQKSIRLQQARRMLVTKQDAARVGYAVGYEKRIAVQPRIRTSVRPAACARRRSPAQRPGRAGSDGLTNRRTENPLYGK